MSLIGIIERHELTDSGRKIGVIYSEIEKCVINSGGIPVGICNDNIDLYIDKCSGFIFQGGDLVDDRNIDIIKKLYDMNIPTLGICLGMQEMAIFGGGELSLIDNHHIDLYHKIRIKDDSLLKKIIGSDMVDVNSRHHFAVINSGFDVVGYTDDLVVEAIEDKSRKFFIGLQWHPEDMYNKYQVVRKIFDYFIKMCND